MINFTIPRIECMDQVFAVVTQDGVAIYPSFDAMIEAFQQQSIVETHEDFDYYMENKDAFIPFDTSDYKNISDILENWSWRRTVIVVL